MISKTSLFNKGIYKSTLRRYAWGSILYFILLFLITGMVILLTINPETYVNYHSIRRNPIILSPDFTIFPMLLSMVIPTVTGLLVFRFVHSRKTSVFIHSLPVKREANYISTVFAGLTLMGLPVILNGIILMIISLSGYGELFSVGSCLTWILLNLFCLFAMFSSVCFVAFITGNSFAMVFLNALFHFFVLILAAGFSKISSLFLHGFSEEYTVVEKVLENTFPIRLGTIMTEWGYAAGKAAMHGGAIVKILIISVVFYILGLLLYRKRRMETVEDIAGFKCLNVIFKYALTFTAFLSSYALLSYFAEENPFVLWCMVIIIGAIVFFGVEMLLKKSFKVWRFYKGFAVVLLLFALTICIFKFTTFFGFETRIPEADNIESASLYEYYHDEKPFFKDEDIKERIRKIHSSLILEENDEERYSIVNIEYLLKNGKTMKRRYKVNEKIHEIMNNLYENSEFKKANEAVFMPIEALYRMNVSGEGGSESITDEKKMSELLAAIKEDMEGLSYSRIHSSGWSFNIELEYTLKEDEDFRTFAEPYTLSSAGGQRVRYFHIGINPNFEKTISWIKENGLWDIVKIRNSGVLYIARDWRELPFFDDDGRILEKNDPEKEKNIIKIEDEEKRAKIIDYIHNTGLDYIPEDEFYTIYKVDDFNAKDYTVLSIIPEKELSK